MDNMSTLVQWGFRRQQVIKTSIIACKYTTNILSLQQQSWLGVHPEYVAVKRCLSNYMKKDLLMLLKPDKIV